MIPPRQDADDGRTKGILLGLLNGARRLPYWWHVWRRWNAVPQTHEDMNRRPIPVKATAADAAAAPRGPPKVTDRSGLVGSRWNNGY